ncbi:MAG: hypothetical protein N4A33_05960 [Bacteriovoracaceae bacterium]|jgi:hypothetical protein|nr:hypothetical protein [Bacteriovoracaceae bacterium]
MKSLVLLFLFGTIVAQASTYVCVAKKGEAMKDAAFAISLESSPVILQGSKSDYLDDNSKFEGLGLTDIFEMYETNKISLYGLLYNAIEYDFVLQTKNKEISGVVKMSSEGETEIINLKCEINKNLEMIKL